MRTKTVITLVASLLASLLFISCKKDKKEVRQLESEIIFQTNIASSNFRVTDSKWDASDAIGVFMMKTGEDIANALTPTNAKYVTSTGGSNSTSFVAVNDANKLVWPLGAGAADFIAYYPHSATLSGVELALEAGDQTNFSAIDYLYSARSTQSENASGATLNFKHVMPILVFGFTDKADKPIVISSITNLKIAGLKVNGTLNLATGVVTPKGTATDILAHEGNALVIPQASETSVVVSFEYDGKSYKWDLGNRTFEQGKKYTFQAKLHDGSVTVSGISGLITNREPGDNVGGVTLNPITPPTEPTTLSADATTFSFTEEAGSHNFVITTDAVAITATSDATWATVPSGEIAVDATGKATLTVNVEANDTTEDRTATITINHNGVLRAAAPIILTITQTAKKNVDPTPSGEGDLIISAYVEGKSNDKYLKISNRTSRDIDLSTYSLHQYNNGNTTATGVYELTLSGTLKAGEFLVVHNPKASVTSFTNASIVIKDTSRVTNFNGDDAVSLAKDGENIDLFGVIGNPNKNEIWKDKIYVRNADIKKPSTTFNEAEWKVENITTPIGEVALFNEVFNAL